MKLLQTLLISGAVLGLASCGCDCEESNTVSTKTNDLLPKKVSIKYEHDMNVPDGSEVLSGFDYASFVNTLSSKALAGELKVYDPNDDKNVLPKRDVDIAVGVYNDTLIDISLETMDTVAQIRTFENDLSQIKRIFFQESWNFNEESFTMSKVVDQYSPIKIYYRDVDTAKLDMLKKQTFWVKGEADENNLQLIKENIAYEFNFYTTNSYRWLENLSIGRFTDILLDNVLEKKVEAYDFFEREKPLTVDEVRMRLGETVEYYYVEDENQQIVDTVEVKGEIYKDEIRSVLFVEDWYYDTKTFQIVKKVKQIAPIRQYINYYENGDQDEVKRVAFVINLN